MDLFYKILAILLSTSILINAYFIKRVVGTWLFPACIFSLFWFAYIFFPLIILFEIPVNIFSILFLILCVIAFSWTSAFFNWNQALEMNKKKEHSSLIYDTKFLRKVLCFSIIVSVLCTIKQVMAQGFSITEIVSSPLTVSGKYMKMKYFSELNKTVYSMIGLVFSYISVLVGGLVYGSTLDRKRKWLSLLSFLPALVVIVIQGAKGLLFLSLFLFLGSVLVTKLYNNDFLLFNKKNIIKIIKSGAILFIFLIISFLSRGLKNIESFSVLVAHMRRLFASYMLTHIYAFSDWFTAYFGGDTQLEYDTSNNFYGLYTFNFFTKTFADKDKLVMGTYGEYFKYQDIIKSNIYTMFRGLIMDFGILGAIAFIVVNGLFIHLIFNIFLVYKKPVVTTALVVFMIGYFYMSFLISLLTWKITVFAFMLFILILFLNKYKFVIKLPIKN